MAQQFKIEGVAELRRRISRLDQRMQRRVYGKAVRAGGKIVVDAAKAKVPRRTGSLAASLVHRASSKPARGLFGVKVTIKRGRFASDRTARRRGVGNVYKPDAVERYYRFVETGTKHHPAKPFLEPALESNASRILATIRRELAAGLARETKSL